VADLPKPFAWNPQSQASMGKNGAMEPRVKDGFSAWPQQKAHFQKTKWRGDELGSAGVPPACFVGVHALVWNWEQAKA
jgi:hypothetical protein